MSSRIYGHIIDNVILGQLLKRLFQEFVEHKAFNSDFGSNPFNIKNYKINYLSLYADGVQVPSKPIQPNFNQD